MRSEQEMYELILGFAKADERVRAVILNGSRANPNAPKDKYQDFDIVYVVRNFSSFTADHGWIDVCGERLMLQMPEAMRDPSGAGHFNWMMLFGDGNRLDLTLVPIEKPELIGRDSERDVYKRQVLAARAEHQLFPEPELLFVLADHLFHGG